MRTSKDNMTTFVPIVFSSSRQVPGLKANFKYSNKDTSVPLKPKQKQASWQYYNNDKIIYNIPTDLTDTDGYLKSEK